MLIAAIAAVAILMLPVGYVLFRKFSVTQQEIEFAAPQDGVKAIHLDIQEDTVRRIRLVFEDGSLAEVGRLRAV